MKFKVLYFVVSSIISIHIANGQISCLTSQIDSLLSIQTEKPFNGIVLITQNGETVYSKACGYSDLENRIPLKINDQFVVGSISKQFTAIIVLREYDKGHLDIYVPIKEYLPNLTESWADTVTIHHLLTHTHGIVALDKPARFATGTQFSYSQIGYDLLAKIVEKTSGKSFIKLSDELFKECGMHHTFHPDLKEYKNLVKGYVENDEEKLEYTDETFSKYPTGKAFVGLEAYPAAGMFVSTAGDLALWSNNLFGKKLLKESTLQLMTTKQDKAIKKSPVFGFAEYGYGVIVNNEDDILQWAQTGYSPGFVSLTAYFPKSKTNVIVLENVNYDVDNTKKTFYHHTQILDIVRKDMYSLLKPKADYDYLLYLPEDYAGQTKDYPLVIYLHGGSHKGNDLNKLKEYGLPYLVNKGNDFDFVIVSPQCPGNKYWSTEDWFEPLYTKIRTEYRIDVNKVYLTGISMGGYGTFIVAMDYPDKFAAIVPLCGGCNDSDIPRICNLKDIPIWTFHGIDDDLIPISETERIVNALDGCNGKIEFAKLEGEGHEIQYLYEKYPQMYEWMLKQSRSDKSQKQISDKTAK